MTLSTSVSAYLLRRLRSEEDARRDIAEQCRKRLTVITSEDEVRLREFERRMEGEE